MAEARESKTMVREPFGPASTMWAMVSGSIGSVAKLVRYYVVVPNVIARVS